MEILDSNYYFRTSFIARLCILNLSGAHNKRVSPSNMVTSTSTTSSPLLLKPTFLWINLDHTECVSEKQRASLGGNTAPEHADPSLDWICFIKLNNKCLRGLDICMLPSSFTLESDHSAPYGAIPYCIMQCCNRLRLCAGLQGGVLGQL